jgi:hypothetical protein
VYPLDRDLRILLLALSAVPCASGQSSPFVKNLVNYLGMSGMRAADFQPQTQHERNISYREGLINPFGLGKIAGSAGVAQLIPKPESWGQGEEAYGKRVANLGGQYLIQKTVTWGLASALHEDNRYFGSGKHGFGPRALYALESSVLARHDDGSRALSISEIGGFATSAFVAGSWLPPDQNSPSNAAVRFAIGMGGNAAACMLKEFLPDLYHKMRKAH